MFQTIPDLLRKASVESLFAASTFNNSWSLWQNNIRRILGGSITEHGLINLGENLSDIFQTTGGTGREQGSLSGGGAAWESLVCWYINLCCVGSRIVAIKKMSLVPKAIQDAITVNYGNFACNTESDITIIVFPDSNTFSLPISQLSLTDSAGNQLPILRRGSLKKETVNYNVSQEFPRFEIGIIQCKTNWNDNAQIPMLWDMVYSAGGFRGRNITLGRNNFSIRNVLNFSYSFVTVPSNTRAVYTSNSVAVKRVTNLSGGNYWGKPSVQNVAKSLKEIFSNNFSSGFRNDIRTDLRSALPHFANGEALDYFKL